MSQMDKSRNGHRQAGASASATTRQPKGNNVQYSKHPKKPAASNGNGKWVVVVKNVENDFARVHLHAIERFCCLDPKARRNINAPTDASLATSCQYELAPRTETRSVEVSIHTEIGNDDISSIFLPMGSHRKGDETVEGAAAAAEALNANTTPRFTSLEDMVAVLKQKPYFTHPPTLMLGTAEPEKQTRKRDRDDGTNEEVGEDAEEGDNEEERDGPRTFHNVHQRQLVTAVMIVSSSVSAKQLKKTMSDIPGFMSCWLLFPTHFRGLFRDDAALFRAKALLDQFEADGVRIKLQLPDTLTSAYEKYLALEADGNQ